MTTKIPVELSSTPGIVDGSNATAITIDSDEKVGIGTSSPAQKLDVSGYIKTTRIGAGISPIVPCEILSTGTTSTALRVLKSGSDDSTQNNLFSVTEISGHGRLSIHDSAQNEEIRFDSNGASFLSDGLSFDGTTTAASVLDDYEEGIHVATITCGTSGTVSLNGAYSDLSYTKIGRVVTVSGLIIVSSVSSPVGYYTISIPYTCANLTDRAADSNASIHHHYGNNAKPADIVAFLPESSSQIHVYRGDVGVTRSENSAEELRASTQIIFSVTYNVA